jgi:hypothetical protein
MVAKQSQFNCHISWTPCRTLDKSDSYWGLLYKLENTLNYGLEQVWTIGYIKGSNMQVHFIFHFNLHVSLICVCFYMNIVSNDFLSSIFVSFTLNQSIVLKIFKYKFLGVKLQLDMMKEPSWSRLKGKNLLQIWKAMKTLFIHFSLKV